MINRRTLRSKAVKALYAFENCTRANYQIAKDQIAKDFARDLNSMEEYNEALMNEYIDQARKLFKYYVNNNEGPLPEELSKESEVSAKRAFSFYEKSISDDRQQIKKELFKEFESIKKIRLKILSLIVELAWQNKEINDEKRVLSSKFGQNLQVSDTLYDNQVIKILRENETLKEEISRAGVSWDDDKDLLIKWYKGVILKDEVFKEYNRPSARTYEKDWDLVDYIAREIIFKHDIVSEYFEGMDLDWDENKTIVRSLVLKSLKSLKVEGDPFDLAAFSYNWEEDSEFIRTLIDETINNNDYFESLIKNSSKNWEIERIALMDKVVLKTALCEMIHFPSIPVKVSINEFLELSKMYSTPKSKNFVNGMLDVISAQLIEEGKIKKSGRGLIDNK